MCRVIPARRRSAETVLFAAFVLLGCHRSETPGPGGAGPTNEAPAPTESVSRPIDTLAPGELVDGPLRAFELKLPMGVYINEAFSDVVYAWGEVDPMQLANYLRLEVRGGSVSVGAAATVFDKVTTPWNSKRILRIRVDSKGQSRAARLEVRDVTPPPASPAADEAERWRQVGLSPTGKILDPTHLE